MFRARMALVLAAFVGLLLHTTTARAQDNVNFIDGIGYVDYSHAPNFKLGSWISYQTTSSSVSGLKDDYEVTFEIAGEEKFWGEDCFWLESATERSGQTITVASCMSYAVFGDSLRDRPQLFERKTIMGLDENGNPIQNLMRRERTSYRARVKNQGVTVTFDTLGTDTVIVPKGTFKCLKVVRREAVAITKEVGDSTFRGETYDTRTLYYAQNVPITSLVREDTDNLLIRKAWKAGDSEHMVQYVQDHGTASMRLIDWGEGAEARLTPEAFRKTIKRSKTSTGSSG
jgi:hypothetical protein